MKKTRSVFALLLALAMMLTLSACGSGGTTATTPTANPPAATQSGDSSSDPGDTFTCNLIWAHQFSASHIYTNEFVQRFIDTISKATNGRIKITQYPANQLGAAEDYPSMLEADTIQIANIDTGTSVAEFPLHGCWQLPGVFEKSVTSTPALWEMSTTGSLAEELERNGMVCLGAYTIPGYILLYNGHPIRTPDDIKGMKFRVTGASRITAANMLGATIVSMSSSEVSEGLYKKTIDGCINSANAAIQYGYHEMVDYVTTGINLGNFDGHFVISKKTWDSFPDSIKKLFMDTGYECSMHMAELLDSQLSADLETIGQKCEVIKVTEDEAAKWNEILDGVTDEWIKSVDSLGYDGKAIIAERDALLAKYAG